MNSKLSGWVEEKEEEDGRTLANCSTNEVRGVTLVLLSLGIVLGQLCFCLGWVGGLVGGLRRSRRFE